MPSYDPRAQSHPLEPSDLGWHHEDLSIPALWARAGRGEGVRIVHLDTGLDTGHPALSRSLEEVVYIDTDVPRPAKVLCGCVEGGLRHGTRTAGALVGAEVDGTPTGIAPGAKLFYARVQPRTQRCDCGQGPVSEDIAFDLAMGIATGLMWAIECNAHIVTVCLGNLCESGRCIQRHKTLFGPILALLRKRHILPIMAIGNAGPGTGLLPASMTDTMAIGASTRDGDEWEKSCRWGWPGQATIPRPDLLAPGAQIWTTTPGGGGGFSTGTSVAAPIAAGVAAVLLGATGDARATKAVEIAMIRSAQPRGHSAPHLRPLAALDALKQL